MYVVYALVGRWLRWRAAVVFTFESATVEDWTFDLTKVLLCVYHASQT